MKAAGAQALKQLTLASQKNRNQLLTLRGLDCLLPLLAQPSEEVQYHTARMFRHLALGSQPEHRVAALRGAVPLTLALQVRGGEWDGLPLTAAPAGVRNRVGGAETGCARGAFDCAGRWQYLATPCDLRPCCGKTLDVLWLGQPACQALLASRSEQHAFCMPPAKSEVCCTGQAGTWAPHGCTACLHDLSRFACRAPVRKCNALLPL